MHELYTYQDIVETAQTRLPGRQLCLQSLRGFDRVETRFTRSQRDWFLYAIELETNESQTK